ncbi:MULTISPECIES: response regulator [unclassified Flavobacterium]|uniref:response regulator n=1 Tax=unclassified Flavobacterium TaxID=196869 RepID=UPI0010D1E1CA|nr:MULTISPECIES: response regulator [unclassified Flavobacterium]TDP00268.1 CheY-like chemotaxis protein [Flavobacterium sp. 245]TDW52125.1 CheY-like chemotaxis protein [Flavobacterium sp. 270]
MINSENPVGNAKGLEKKEPVKIILAEDDKDDQELFKEALSATKIPSEVITVENGQELVNTLKDPAEPKPDIVFIDINMPVKGGKEALAEIKSDQELKEIPTVMLSTSNHPNDIEDTFNKGANLYIQKPSSFTGFILILKRVFLLHWAKALVNPVKNIFFVSEKNISQKE